MPNISPMADVRHLQTKYELNERIALHSVVLSLMTIAVAVRLYTRAVIIKKFCLDDYFCIVAWALCFTFSIFMVYVTEFGVEQYLSIHNGVHHNKKWFGVALRTYFPAMLAVKLCLLLGFHRIFKVDTRTRYLIWAGVIVNSIAYTLFFLYGILRCTPVRASWDPNVKGKCVSYIWIPWVIGIFNVVSDFYILLLPMPVLFAMHMATMRRIRLVSIFGLGLLTCIASIICSVIRIKASSRSGSRDDETKKLHWTYFCICLLELNVGLICACAVTFPAFFDASNPRSFGALVSALRTKSFLASKTHASADDRIQDLCSSFRSWRRSDDSLEMLKERK